MISFEKKIGKRIFQSSLAIRIRIYLAFYELVTEEKE